MSITIRDALQLEAYSSCQLIAGKKGINNIVLYMDSMEVPDIQPWLRANLLMITTGYSIKDDPPALKQLVQDLHNTGCAGLAIKTRFLGSIPQEIIDEADSLSLPIILIPDSTSVASLVLPLMNMIYDDQNIFVQSKYFFIDLISQSIHSEQEARMRAEAMHWPKPPMKLLLFRRNTSPVKDEQRQYYRQEQELMQKIYRRVIESIPAPLLLPINDNIILLVPDTPTPDLQSFCAEMLDYFNHTLSMDVTIGISDTFHSYTRLHTAFQDAVDAIKIGEIEGTDQKIVPIDHLRFEQALLEFSCNSRLKTYIEGVFAPLEKYDSENNGSLVDTMRIFVKNLGSKAKTSEDLFLHRNSLIYRIKKIEEITDLSLSDKKTISNLSLIFKIYPYIESMQDCISERFPD